MEFQPMSPEDMQRAMQFLLNQQAQFAADFEKLSIKTDKMADAIIGLTGIVGHAIDGIDRLTTGMDRLTTGMDRLTTGMDQLTVAQERTDRQLNDLRDQVKMTDAYLNVVIQMFERHLREDHGRKPS